MDSKDMEVILLKAVYAAAHKICEWSWDDIDPEPSKDMERLKKAVEDAEKFIALEEQAFKTMRAQSMRNMA